MRTPPRILDRIFRNSSRCRAKCQIRSSLVKDEERNKVVHIFNLGQDGRSWGQQTSIYSTTASTIVRTAMKFLRILAENSISGSFLGVDRLWIPT